MTSGKTSLIVRLTERAMKWVAIYACIALMTYSLYIVLCILLVSLVVSIVVEVCLVALGASKK